MKTLLFKKPYLLTILLLIVSLFLGISLLAEKRKNEPYKKEIEIIKKIIIKSNKEGTEIEEEKKKVFHPLSWEKEKKEKFGENLEGEKVIFISDEILKNTNVFKK